jgi:hypothetical protein
MDLGSIARDSETVMKKQTRWIAVGATFVLLSAVVQAATIFYEPDAYLGEMSGAAAGARLVTLRGNDLGTDFAFQKVYSVEGGSWSPTGTRVFGHSVLSPGEQAYHWDNLAGPSGAWSCYQFGTCGDFKVFGVYFRAPAQTVKVLTTLRGEQALDPVELWAFDTNGQRVLQCRLDGITNEVLQTGVLPPPAYYNVPAPTDGLACGKVLGKKNCMPYPNAPPGDCDYVVEMRVQRRPGDIGFVWFGGTFWQNTHANVDRLTYTVP